MEGNHVHSYISCFFFSVRMVAAACSHTWQLESMSFPEMICTWGPGAATICLVCMLRPENCRVAPSNESILWLWLLVVMCLRKRKEGQVSLKSCARHEHQVLTALRLVKPSQQSHYEVSVQIGMLTMEPRKPARKPSTMTGH